MSYDSRIDSVTCSFTVKAHLEKRDALLSPSITFYIHMIQQTTSARTGRTGSSGKHHKCHHIPREDTPMSTPSPSLHTTITQSRIADLSGSRPRLGIVLNLLILIAGLTAPASVAVRERPEVDNLVLSIRTAGEGAVAKTADKEIT